MRVIVARSNSFIPLKCKKSIHVVFHYRSPETARPSFHGNLRKAMPSRLCWLALPFAGMVAFRRFRLSAAEFAANRRFKVHKRSQLFIRTHNEMLSIVAMRIGNESLSKCRICPCS
jgi:hypothetical protein